MASPARTASRRRTGSTFHGEDVTNAATSYMTPMAQVVSRRGDPNKRCVQSERTQSSDQCGCGLHNCDGLDAQEFCEPLRSAFSAITAEALTAVGAVRHHARRIVDQGDT